MTATVAPTRELELAEALSTLRARIAVAAQAAGRDENEIELLPVTKFFPASDVQILAQLGCRSFAESRAQEASNKIAELREIAGATTVRWHMVGHIQRNKARAITGWAYTAHSVDSRKVLDALDRAATEALADGRRTEPLRVCIQLSLDGNERRGGIYVERPDLVDEMCAAAEAAEGLVFAGLMAIPPLDADAETAFGRLQTEHQRVQNHYHQRLELSAGMSSDLEAAIKHGSTCVRVGTALLGPRPLTFP